MGFSFQIVLVYAHILVAAHLIVHVEFSGCMKKVFKLFIMNKVEGIVFVFSLALNRMGSQKSKYAIVVDLTLRPNRRSIGVFAYCL